jgi:putative Holliday junction resolvase
LAFDYGERRIGVAFANGETSLATPLTTLSARDGVPDWEELGALVAEWQPQVLVIGVPYNMDGSDSTLTAMATAFADQVGSRFTLPTELVDERLTSVEASRELKQQRQTGARKRRVRREDIDRHAARLIAESWLRNVKPTKNKNA